MYIGVSGGCAVHNTCKHTYKAHNTCAHNPRTTHKPQHPPHTTHNALHTKHPLYTWSPWSLGNMRSVGVPRNTSPAANSHSSSQSGSMLALLVLASSMLSVPAKKGRSERSLACIWCWVRVGWWIPGVAVVVCVAGGRGQCVCAPAIWSCAHTHTHTLLNITYAPTQPA